MMAAALSFGILLLNRALGWDIRFFRARNVSKSLIAIAIVVIVTAYLSGGVGFFIFGSRSIGSKRYLYILLGILAYFGFSSVTIPRRWAGVAVAVFFLSSLTGAIGYLAAWGGPPFYYLVELFPIESALDELSSTGLELTNNSFTRYGGLLNIGLGLSCFLFARYGARGLFDMSRPWRFALMAVAFVLIMFSGFRSAVIMLLVTFALMFYVEGLFRTRLFPILTLTVVLVMAASLPFISKMPLAVQRSLAFLPLNVDPIVSRSAEDSSDWRFEMWKEVIPTVPKYLIKGKGLALTPTDMEMIAQAQQFGGIATSYEASMLAGDYHSGPLSLIIPFGLFGVAAFLWFLWASLQVLRKNYLYGDPVLRRSNTFLYTFFIIRIIAYFFVFGSFYSDLVYFATLIGLSVSLNGGVAGPRDEDDLMEAETA
jgi:hypothetical protein